MDEDELFKRLEWKIPAESVHELVGAYRDARTISRAATTGFELYNAIQSDLVFRMPVIRLAETLENRDQSVYSYLFNWPSPLMEGALGACHALELGFIFGTKDEYFGGTGPAANALENTMQDAWLAFARTGNPSCERTGVWPAYGKQRNTMLLGETSVVQKDPGSQERRACEAIHEKVFGFF